MMSRGSRSSGSGGASPDSIHGVLLTVSSAIRKPLSRGSPPPARERSGRPFRLSWASGRVGGPSPVTLCPGSLEAGRPRTGLGVAAIRGSLGHAADRTMSSRRMIVAKLRPPPLAAVLIPRPRVQDALEGAAATHRVLLVIAGAGAGKPTAAARFLEARRGRAAWLSLDPSDIAAGRFVSYLAAAVGRAEPRLETMVQDSLADGLLTEDCAGLLAERLGPGWTIVLDDLHHLEPDAPALVPLRAFLRYLPADALAVLVSRRMPSVDL